MWFGTAGTGAVETLAFAPDSRALYTADGVGQLLAWDTSSRERRALLKKSDPDAYPWFDLSPCGRFLLVRKMDDVIVRDAETGALVSRDTLSEDLRRARALSPCGRYYVGYSPDFRTACRWDWAARREAEPLALKLPPCDGVRSWFALHANGRAAVGDPYTQALALYDTGTGDELWRTRVLGDRYARIVFDHGGERVLVVGQYADIICVRASDGATLWSAKPGGRLNGASRCAFHPSRPLFAFVSPRYYGTQFVRDQTAWFGDLNTGERVIVPDPRFDRANGVAFSPDGLTCAVGSGASRFCVFDLDG